MRIGYEQCWHSLSAFSGATSPHNNNHMHITHPMVQNKVEESVSLAVCAAVFFVCVFTGGYIELGRVRVGPG